MPKNIVICCDGTGNEINNTISNVLKLYRILTKNARQRVYYNPGIGTIGDQNAWQRIAQKFRGVFGLATGYGLDRDILATYRFLCETYESGDRVWLFGFSRGAYTVRALAGFVHVMGLLPRDQLNIATYALTAYKKASSVSRNESATPQRSPELESAWHFSRVAGGFPIKFEFIGVWDTVASIIVPRDDRLLPDLQTLRFTRTNPSVKILRQAIAIDERRRMFRLNRWTEPQKFLQKPFDQSSAVAQDIRQVWFAGVHADIGGGYPEEESGLGKFPLHWMVEQAAKAGLLVNRAAINQLVLGKKRQDGRLQYVAPNAGGKLHTSLTWGWWLIEWIPKLTKWREWPGRWSILGLYIPWGEPRLIPDGALVHRSVIERMRLPDVEYDPVNLPGKFTRENFPPQPRGGTTTRNTSVKRSSSKAKPASKKRPSKPKPKRKAKRRR